MKIGTAGWSIPTAFAGDFPSGGSHLERYAQVFSAVEINSSFHRPHRRATYERWAASVPPDFRFSVKIPKTVSHTARLVDCEHLLDAFVDETGGLAGKLDIVLLQMPPSLVYDERIADVFFRALRDRLAKATQIACEPRHASWFAEPAAACMTSHRVARVAADPVLVPGGEQPGGWTGLHYHRLHGTPRVYYSAYDSTRLATLANAAAVDVPTWCIFDNTASGAATGNALTLQSLAPPA